MRHTCKLLFILSVAVLAIPGISARIITKQSGWCTYELDTETKTGRVVKCTGDKFNIGEDVVDGTDVYKTRSIGPEVFVGSAIRKVTVPAYVTSIHPRAFCGDNVLNEVIFATSSTPLELEGVASEMFAGTPVTKLYWDRPISGKMQMASPTLSEAYIGPNVLSLPEGVFYNCPALKTVTVADGTSDLCVVVQSFADSPMGYSNLTFGDDAALETLYVGRRISCASWGASMNQWGLPFKNLKKLTSLTIGPSVAEITPVSSFAGCSSLKNITIPATVKTVWSGCFVSVPLEKVVIEDSEDKLTNVSPGRLFGMTTIREVYLGRPFEESLILEFPNVEELTIAGPVENVGHICNNATLTKLTFNAPGKLDNFNGCSELREVVVGDNVTSLGSWAFSNCPLLGSVSLGNGLKTISSGAFDGNKTLESFTIPATVKSAPINYGDNIKSIIIADSDTELTLGVGGNLKASPFETIYIGRPVWQYYPLIRNNVKSVEFASTLKNIPDNMFAGNFKGSDIKIQWPAEISTIGERAFYSCSFDNLELPAAECLTIEKEAFRSAGVSKLSIKNTKKLMIKDKAFYFSGITGIEMDTEGDNGVTGVGEYAFYNAKNFTGLDFASDVTKIGKNAFNGASSCVINSHIKNAPDTIGEYAFYGIRGSELIIDAGLKRLENYSLQRIHRLTLGDGIKDIELPPHLGSYFEYLAVSTPEVWIKLANNTSTNNRDNYTINGTKVDEYPFGDLTVADDVKSLDCITIGNPNITSIRLGKNVTYVGGKLFDECPNLTTIHLNGNLEQFHTNLEFSNVEIVEIENLDKYARLERSYYGYYGYPVWVIVSGKEGIRCNGQLVKSYTFNTDNDDIVLGAFWGVKSLEKVIIPEGITKIESGAFRGTSITDVALPSTLETLGEHALPFENIILPKKLVNIITVGSIYWDNRNIYHLPSHALHFLKGTGQSINYEDQFTRVKTLHVPAGKKAFFAEAYNIDPTKVIDDLPGDAAYAGDSNILSWEVFSDDNCNIVPDGYVLRLYSGETADDDKLLYEKHYDSFANEVPALTGIKERN